MSAYFTAGFASVTNEYDDYGNISKTQYFDANGNPTPYKERGYASFTQIYDGYLLMESSYFDIGGKLTMRRDSGYAILRNEYDNNGLLIKQSYFNTLNEPTPLKDHGHAYELIIRNPKGEQIENYYYDKSDQLVNRWDTGYAILKRKYDKHGNTVRWDYFDNEKNPAKYKGRGFVSCEAGYEDGNWVEERYYDKDGNLTPHIEKGYAIIKNEYDKGYRTRESYFGADEKPVPYKGKGYAAIDMKRDLRDNVTEYRYYNTVGDLMQCYDTGIAISRYEYDDYGNTVSGKFFDTAENPTTLQALWFRLRVFNYYI